MKAILIFILVIIFYSCGSKNIKVGSNTETIIDIIDKRDYIRDDLIHKIGFHKDHEVKIYTSPPPFNGSKDPQYILYIYKKEEGQIGRFSFWGHYKYDKVAYKWANDSILHFKLYNSKNDSFDNYTYQLKKDSEELGMDRN